MEETHAAIDFLAKMVELAGAGIIVTGTLLSTAYFLWDGVKGDWRQAYDLYRANLGRGILLGLELLVGADIMSTVTAPLTFTSLGLLAAIVAIRTFLSFSLETEIEGCWPWQRSAVPAVGKSADYPWACKTGFGNTFT
ncbi:membrane protein [Sphingobium sp. TomTYG75]